MQYQLQSWNFSMAKKCLNLKPGLQKPQLLGAHWSCFTVTKLFLCLILSPLLTPGEPCPVNGRSPGSVSTQHSSPRSDAASASGPPAVTIPAATSPPEGSTLQTSDVVIHRKDNEGFGFVIISSLNRPENATVISELPLSGDLKVVAEYKCWFVNFKDVGS